MQPSAWVEAHERGNKERMVGWPLENSTLKSVMRGLEFQAQGIIGKICKAIEPFELRKEIIRALISGPSSARMWWDRF
jgi:hypothetical protein